MTSTQVSFHPAAIDEAEAAARWYRERSRRAAARFVTDLFDVIDRVVGAPLRWPLHGRGTRKAKLPCFPFLVIYRTSDTAVEILAVAHCRRRPNYWRDRL
ncbi:MAG: type II toxin-antitoxin system RelE/ParE family toxin [Candidatus Acidiferrales bacterium]